MRDPINNVKFYLQLDDVDLDFGTSLWHVSSVLHRSHFMRVRHLPTKLPRSSFSLVNNSIVDLPRAVVSLLHWYDDIVMMRQVPAQADILCVLIRAQMTRESSLSTALETHVPRQVMLQRVPLPAGGTLETLIFSVAGMSRARFDLRYLRGSNVHFSSVDSHGSWRMEALVKT